jgi:hypothetical protein
MEAGSADKVAVTGLGGVGGTGGGFGGRLQPLATINKASIPRTKIQFLLL